MAVDIHELRALTPPAGMPFKIQRLGHVVLQVSNLDRSIRFYTQVLGFKVSDVYPEDVQPGGFAFLRCNPDHHAIALAGSGPGDSKHAELHHIAFEVRRSSRSSGCAKRCANTMLRSRSKGVAEPVAKSP
jgi:catechol-2,3-dioxygenase